MCRAAGAMPSMMFWVTQAWAADIPLIPVEDFARAPQYADMQLSPDGSCVGYQVQEDGGSGLGFFPLDDQKPVGVFWERKGDLPFNAIFDYHWISSKRVIMNTALGWAVADRGTRLVKYLTGFGRYLEERKSQFGTREIAAIYPDGLVVDDRQDATILHMLNRSDVSGMERRPDIYKLDVGNGNYGLLEKNPGNVESWAADWEGNIRFGLINDGVHTELIYRAEPGGPWSTPLEFGQVGANCSIAGLDADNRTLYVFKPSPKGRLALYSFDLQTRKFSEPLFQHDKYDVGAAVFSPKHRRLLGVRYETDGPRQYWFEPEFARLQKELDAATPGLVNEIVSMDREMHQLLIFSHSDRESGFYTLVDLGTGKTRPLGKTRLWLKPADMAEMHPVRCQARDGVELNGYLTLPVGRGQKNLPMVTLVHGGPYGVRDVWGFDPLVQFLANRGYAVLQVNYRGSGSYGTEFYLRGRHQVGAAIQDDIVDFTQWAVQHGVADPHRLAIMGGSFGGYSTLFALAHTPELFRCGIAVAAVSDWNALFKYFRSEHQYSNDALRYWTVMLGGLQDAREREKLATVSPLNLAAQIKAPLFIMHGEEDTTVPVEQAHAMVAALKKAGRPPETLYFEHLGHSWPGNKDGMEFFRRLETFLAANLKAN
jgi:dipeptidyl aminopeptidase/acylaminoacyl peptidase